MFYNGFSHYEMSEVFWAISVKFCYTFRSMFNFIIPIQKFRVLP